MGENNKERHIRNAYKEDGSLKGGFQTHTSLRKGTNDEIVRNDEDIKNRWQTYSPDLLNATTVERNMSLDNAQTNETETEQEVENDPPDIVDTEIATQSVRNNTAPGTDSFHIKPYQKGGQLLIHMLHSLTKRIWIEEKGPTEWTANIIVTICNKKGHKLQQYHYYAQGQNTNHSYQKHT
jgi:hypothetical protein